MSLDDDARAELRALAAGHRLRVPRVLESAQGPVVVVDGVEVVNFASNDYLGLANDRRLVRAAVAALDEDGVGVGASRLIVGNHRRHVALEATIAEWMRRDGVRVFNSGFAANTGVIAALVREGDLVFSDELNHASIIDGCRLARAEVVIYPHRDVAALERGLERSAGRRRFVVSESMFSMEGDFADVATIARLCDRSGAAFVLDEAHAIGVLGPEGRGLAAEVGVVPDVVIGTFGKALGTFGAFAATTRAIADVLWNRARTLVFSTGLPPSVSAATQAAIEIVRGGEGDQRREALASRARMLRALVPRAGGDPRSPIAPLIIGDDQQVMQIATYLFEARIFVQGIRPPTVPPGTARLRFSVSASHTVEQLEIAVERLNNATR